MSPHRVRHFVCDSDVSYQAERQRRFLEKESAGLKHRLTSNRADVERQERVRLRENSNLLYECNDLRRQVLTTLLCTHTYLLEFVLQPHSVSPPSTNNVVLYR